MRTISLLSLLSLLSLASLASLGVVGCAPADDEDPSLGVVRSALGTHTVEGETFTYGRRFDDGLASGGRALELRSNQPASQNVYFPFPIHRVVLRVRGDQCVGAPVLSFSVGGATPTTIPVTATSWTDVELALPINVNASTIAINFTNPLSAGLCKRALYLDKIDFVNDTPPPPPPTEWSSEGEWFSGEGANPSDATASAGAYRRLRSNATISTPLSSPQRPVDITVRARGVSCASPPHMDVWVAGHKVISTDVTETTWTSFSAPVVGLAPGTHQVKVVLQSSPSSGCYPELHVDKVTVGLAPP